MAVEQGETRPTAIKKEIKMSSIAWAARRGMGGAEGSGASNSG